MPVSDPEPHLVAFRDHALTASQVSPPTFPRPAYVEERWADRVARWRDDPRVMAAALALVALAAGVFFYRSALGTGGAPAAGPAPARATREMAPTSTTTAEVVVHVSGAVAAPGVYRLEAGARVTDAIAVAGGPVDGAEPDRLNLAALVGDGQRVYVPRAGEAIPDGGSASGGTDGGVSGPVNLNLATAEQLEELPGVGPSLAGAIVAERDRRGGFRSVDDLLSVRGIGEKRLADLRALVVV